MIRRAAMLLLVALPALSACGEKAAVDSPPPDSPATVLTEVPRRTVAAVEVDPATGFRMSGDWQLVRAHCTGCHSSKLITQQRGSARQWLKMIRWMQKKQNLWQFDAETERRIIAYLAENYPPDEARRRAALPRDLMPPNPYANSTAN